MAARGLGGGGGGHRGVAAATMTQVSLIDAVTDRIKTATDELGWFLTMEEVRVRW